MQRLPDAPNNLNMDRSLKASGGEDIEPGFLYIKENTYLTPENTYLTPAEIYPRTLFLTVFAGGPKIGETHVLRKIARQRLSLHRGVHMPG